MADTFNKLALASAAAAVIGCVSAAQAGTPTADRARSIETQARAHIASFSGYTGHDNDHGYVLRDTLVDDDGTQHARFDRTYRGMPVIGGDLVVHSDRNGNFRDVSMTMKRNITVARSATLIAGRAATAALDRHAGTIGSTPTAVVYAGGDTPVLAWDVRVYGQQADGTPSEKHVIVDASTGAVLAAWDDVHSIAASGMGLSIYSGTVPLTTNYVPKNANPKYEYPGFELLDPTRGNSYTINVRNGIDDPVTGVFIKKPVSFRALFNIWGVTPASDSRNAEVDAQYGASKTWDYYKKIHGRNGWDNEGSPILSRVHYGKNFSNAFYKKRCNCVTYGDGDGDGDKTGPFVALDIVGHEITHAVTNKTAKLLPTGEPGGLNEATSDIFGEMVEFHANNSSSPGNYLVGSQIFRNGSGPNGLRAIRSMINPSRDGRSPDCWYPNVGDLPNHKSAGVGNHFFFLLAEGTTSGRPSKTCETGNSGEATGNGTVVGIGRDKAAKIWYRALTVHMTSNTKYADARAYTISAARALYGQSSAEARAVAAAWTAVGVLPQK